MFTSVLRKVKARTHVPVLLPSELPEPVRKAKHALAEKVEVNQYAISLYYELGVGDAGFAALFSAEAAPKYGVRELKGLHKLKLSSGTLGLFRPVTCGGSCAPANLWWESGGTLYQIQLELSPMLSEQAQEKAIVALADSAILAGPR